MENDKEQLATPLPEAQRPSSTSDLNENAAPVSEETAADARGAISTATSLANQKLKEEMAELYQRLLRKQAELENFRKRAQREKEEFRQFATEGLIRDLLPVLDGFERALRQRTPGVPEPFYQGMELIYRQLSEVLARAGLEAMETRGQLFDPHYHQAVETVEEPGRRDQEVVEELQRGYKLKHRLLRPAIVKVAVKRKGGPQTTEGIVKVD
ncbi:MAG TPA: nucleotide exchange factor GrpE [Terriglobia bacterium]|nr:nucleotide exchange factor GrpE [Terriglobia bacterium]